MTPREKWDAGVKLTEAEVDELLADGVTSETIIARLGDKPIPLGELARAVGQPEAKTMEILRHLASEPVWLARETPEGWLPQHGEEPAPAGAAS